MEYTKEFNLEVARRIREVVVPNFRKVLPLANKENSLDMGESKVNVNHICGTVHCHGGWYAVAVADLSNKVDFYFGAERIGEDLGFDNSNNAADIKLALWARNNKLFWDSQDGSLMFNCASAFTSDSRPKGAQSLSDIVDHWLEVADRIETHYEVKPTYKDATKEILGLELQPSREQDLVNQMDMTHE